MMIHPPFRTAAPPAAFVSGLRNVFRGCAVALCVTAWTAASDEAMAQAVAPCTHDVSWDNPPQSTPPADICGTGDSAADFHAFSWQLFKFLAWPASAQRGIPDLARKITDQGPSTFETLKADWEIFRENAETPGDWSAFPALADACSNQPKIEPGALVLATFNEFGNITEGELGSSSVHLLVAQNQSYVRYQAAFNQAAFDTILHNNLYDTSKVSGIPPAPDGTRVAAAAEQPAGALTVKSAWIELPGQERSTPRGSMSGRRPGFRIRTPTPAGSPMSVSSDFTSSTSRRRGRSGSGRPSSTSTTCRSQILSRTGLIRSTTAAARR